MLEGSCLTLRSRHEVFAALAGEAKKDYFLLFFNLLSEQICLRIIDRHVTPACLSPISHYKSSLQYQILAVPEREATK